MADYESLIFTMAKQVNHTCEDRRKHAHVCVGGWVCSHACVHVSQDQNALSYIGNVRYDETSGTEQEATATSGEA